MTHTEQLNRINEMTPAEWVKLIDERTERFLLIKNLFGYNKFLGEDVKQLTTNKYYYNDYFNLLWDMSLKELREYEKNMGNEVAYYQSMINSFTEAE